MNKPIKLTVPQLRVLRHLNDGDKVYHPYSTGFCIASGAWGTVNFATITIDKLFELDLVHITYAAEASHIHLTDKGRAALKDADRANVYHMTDYTEDTDYA